MCHSGDTRSSTLVARASVSSWRLEASDGADPDESLSITEALVVDDDGRRTSRQSSTLRPLLSPAAQSRRQRGGIGRTGGGSRRRRGSARGCHRHGQGAGRAVDKLFASHPSLACRLAFQVARTLLQVPPKRRSDARRRRCRLASSLSCLAIVAPCATIEFSNLRHLADSPPTCSVLLPTC